MYLTFCTVLRFKLQGRLHFVKSCLWEVEDKFRTFIELKNRHDMHGCVCCRTWRNRKHFPYFHSVIESRVEFFTALFRVFPNFHECFYIVWEHEKIGTCEKVFDFFYQITRRKLKRENSLLRQRVNSTYCSWDNVYYLII